MKIPNIDYEDLKRRLALIWANQPAALASAQSELIQCRSNNEYLQRVLELGHATSQADQIVLDWAINLSRNFVSLPPTPVLRFHG